MMSGLQQLLQACGMEEKTLLMQARSGGTDHERLLLPVSVDEPAGADPGYDDDFQRIREEVNKLSGVDTALICQLAEKSLTAAGKDLRTLAFYTWARLHRDGEAGLAAGLELLAAMLEKFGSQLHPRRERSRRAALEWLGSNRMTDSLLLYPEVDMAVMQRIAAALVLTEQSLQAGCDDAKPNLAPLCQALENRLVQSGGAASLVPQTSRHEDPPAAASSVPAPGAVTSGRDLLDRAKALALYLCDQPGGWLAAHHLMKSVRWDTLTALPPLDAAGRTRLLAPKPDNRAHLRRLCLQMSWSELLEYTDTLMAQGVNHLWLDVQWYAWQALMKLDSDTTRADILCRDLQGLLARLPGLETLAFDDGTPFADDVTLNWINEKVRDVNSGWGTEPVTSTLDDDVLALEAEVLALADSEGLEAALGWLQARPGFTSTRDRWLVRLLMARIAEQCGKNDMALHLLSELNDSARALTLEQWKPGLMFEVKARQLRLLRAKAGRSGADKARWQADMDALLSGLINLDPARAAVLCD